MTDEKDDELPAESLYLRFIGQRLHQPVQGQYRGVITLETEFTNIALWDGLLQRFQEGFTVSRIKNFEEAVTSAMRHELDAREEELKRERILHNQLKHKYAILEKQVSELHEVLSQFDFELSQ